MQTNMQTYIQTHEENHLHFMFVLLFSSWRLSSVLAHFIFFRVGLLFYFSVPFFSTFFLFIYYFALYLFIKSLQCDCKFMRAPITG